MLASCSSVLLSLLSDCAHPHPMVYLRGLALAHLLPILDFMYRGEARVEQEDLADFLKTAEELGVKGLTEKEEEVSPEQVESQEITPMRATVGNISPESTASGTSEGGGSTALRTSKGGEDARSKKKSRRELKTNVKKEIIVRDIRYDEAECAAVLDVSAHQRKVSGLIKSAITAAEGEIAALEKQSLGPCEMSSPVKDATDDTISEVERMLRETKEILGQEKCLSANGVSDVKGSSVVKSPAAPLQTPLKKVPPCDERPAAGTPPTNHRPKTLKSSAFTKPAAPDKPASSPASSPDQPAPQAPAPPPESKSTSAPQTPRSDFSPSAKDRQVIACLVTKLSGGHGWRCTMCRQTFASKAETEEHVGRSHVQGQLS